MASGASDEQEQYSRREKSRELALQGVVGQGRHRTVILSEPWLVILSEAKNLSCFLVEGKRKRDSSLRSVENHRASHAFAVAGGVGTITTS